MESWEDLLQRLQFGLADIEQLDEPVRGQVVDFLDALERTHRAALEGLAAEVGEERLEEARAADPRAAWLLDAYGIGVDERAEAEEALEPVLPYIHSHGGTLEVLGASGGVVHVRLAGTCSGCTASAVTLREGVERALEEGLPGFVALEVEEVEAEAHPPPGPTLIQLENRLG